MLRSTHVGFPLRADALVTRMQTEARTRFAELELARHVDAGIVDEQLWTGGCGD